MDDRKRLVLKTAGAATLLATAAVLGWLTLGRGEGEGQEAQAGESAEARRERRDDRREEQAARLRQAVEARRRESVARPPTPGPIAVEEPPGPEDRSPAMLTGAEKAALGAVVRGFYSPERLREALEKKTAPDLVREMNRAYGETYHAKSLGGPGGDVPVTPAVREAVQRMGVLKDYGMNLLHAQRPEGQEALQQEMIERVNAVFSERIDALNADYPFLDARLVEP